MEEQKPLSISVTGCMDYIQSPKHYKAFHIDKLRQPSQAMWDGVALHLAVLEPQRFLEKVYIDMKAPNGKRLLDTVMDIKKFLIENGSLVGGKKEDLVLEARRLISENQIETAILYDDLVALYEKKIRLTPATYDKVISMRDSVLQNKFVKTHMGKGQTEMSIQGVIEGVVVRGRMDWMFYDEKLKANVILDLKSSRTAQFKRFQSIIAQSNYHVQAWLYSELVRQNFGRDTVYAWIVAESMLPYITEVYACDMGALEKASHVARDALIRFKKSYEENRWDGYSDGRLANISIPDWAFNIETSLDGEEGI